MANIFNSVKFKLQRKNKFNLSHFSRLTTEFGRLTPILCEEVLPNDTFKISTAMRCQFAPMKFPVMQRFTAYIHYFFVARRLLMDDWEQFITRGEDGTVIVPYPVGVVSADFRDYLDENGGFKLTKASSLWDYLGFPTQDLDNARIPLEVEECHDFDLLPFKAYQLIYNEWYRDQTLSEEIDIHSEVSGMHNITGKLPQSAVVELLKLRNRAWKKDYFTSALPDPQRGPDVSLPLFGDMDVIGKDNAYFEVGSSGLKGANDSVAAPATPLITHSSGGNQMFVGVGDESAFQNDQRVKVVGTVNGDDVANVLDVDVKNRRSATVNEVRRAFAIQRWYELAARAGNRYIEQILAHFGIRSSDARLQRPEYLGGAAIPVNIGDILQTSESNETPLGTPAGIGQAAGVAKLRKGRFTSEEHGYIIGILSIIPEASYPEGMPRKFLRRSTFDFAWPLLANIGEQEIQKQELYYDWGDSRDENESGFGYAPRYSEYKFGVSQVHGDFRTSLRDFHDARFFSRRPSLNQEFIEVSTENDGDDGLNRIFAVRDSSMADHLWVSLYNNIRVRRVLPKYGTPI